MELLKSPAMTTTKNAALNTLGSAAAGAAVMSFTTGNIPMGLAAGAIAIGALVCYELLP